MQKPPSFVGRILKWGNSYGIRISKADWERLGLAEGDDVVLQLVATPRRPVDLTRLRSWDLGGLADITARFDDWSLS